MENSHQADIQVLQQQAFVLKDLAHNKSLQTLDVAITDTDFRPDANAARITQELDQIGILANTIAHQYGIIFSIGLPSISRDVALMLKLATSSCTKAVNACFGKSTQEAYAAQEDYAALARTYHRLSARFYGALGQADSRVEALMAGWAVIASIAKIGQHATRIATMTA